MNEIIEKCGFIAIVGKPNVGKSTLMNRLLGQKISITSEKPQTTRHRILGIKTVAKKQFVYIDTPGMHKNIKHAINRYMNRSASSVLQDADIVVFVVEALRWTHEDEQVLKKLNKCKSPVLLVINKIDLIKDKDRMLPFISVITEKRTFTEVIPLSSQTGDNLDTLEEVVGQYLPTGAALFPEDQITDKSERFLAAEIIREKLARKLRQEIPYALTVEIEDFKDQDKLIHIDAVIWVERSTQKGIVIGKDGSGLKTIGKRARIDMENLFDKKVFLNLWVKVKEGWTDNEKNLQSFGYSDI